MKRKTLVLGLAAILLLVLPMVAMISSRTAEPVLKTDMDLVSETVLESKPVDKCFVSWWKAGILDINVFYADGDLDAQLLSVDDARQEYADNEEIMTKIDEVAATERNVVWWQNETDVNVGIGDMDEVLPMAEAKEKYKDNPIISDKLFHLWMDSMMPAQPTAPPRPTSMP